MTIAAPAGGGAAVGFAVCRGDAWGPAEVVRAKTPPPFSSFRYQAQPRPGLVLAASGARVLAAWTEPGPLEMVADPYASGEGLLTLAGAVRDPSELWTAVPDLATDPADPRQARTELPEAIGATEGGWLLLWRAVPHSDPTSQGTTYRSREVSVSGIL